MRRVAWVLLSAASLCYPQKVTLINACCQAFPQLQFSVGTPSQSVTLSYGFVSPQLLLSAGPNQITVQLPATPGSPTTVLNTGSITLTAGSDYTLAFFGPIAGVTYQLIGPAQNMTAGDTTGTKFSMRFVLLAPYVEQSQGSIHLQVLCPSTGGVAILDIAGTGQSFSNYQSVTSNNLQDNCQLRVVRILSPSTPPVIVIQKSFFLSVGVNYTVVAVGQDSTTTDLKLIVDNDP